MLKREKKNLDHFCIEVFFELLATTKLQWRGWNISKQSYGTQAPSLARSIRKLKSSGKWILGLPRNEICLAKKNVLSRHSSGVAYHPYACNNCISELDRTVVDWDLGLGGLGLGTWWIGTWDLRLGALRSWTWDLVDRDLVDRDLVDRDLVDRDLVDRDLVDRDLVDRDLVDWDFMDWHLVDYNLGFGGLGYGTW